MNNKQCYINVRLSFLILAIFTFYSVSAFGAVTGDVDNSGTIDSSDVVLSLQVCAGMSKSTNIDRIAASGDLDDNDPAVFPIEAISQTIVYPSDGSDQELLAAKEVRRYIYLRTDQKLSLQGVKSLPGSGDVILVANADNAMVNSLSRLINHPIVSEGIVIKTVRSGGRNILVITGNDGPSTLRAAYRYAEKLGVTFDLAEVIIPDTKINLDITGYDEAGEPVFEIRGIQPFHNFASGPDLWNTDDYLKIITQLSKMGLNFIGFHNYTEYHSAWDVDQNGKRGPEANVWIGLPQDVNADGTVNWSYAAYSAHSQRPNGIWGSSICNTGEYSGGAADLFPTDGYGSEVMGENPPQEGDVAASNGVFNRAGQMFNTAFTHAKNLGVITATGTELPMGLWQDGYDENFVRGMPTELQNRLTGMGMNPSDPATVKEVYKGIFQRIMNTHPLDYYWLWSWEIFPGENATQIQAMENDINLAKQALAELGNPFKLGWVGWQLGTASNPAEFEDVFPSDAPYTSLMGSAIGYDQLSESSVKWPGSWLEYDMSLGQPGSWFSAHEDAYWSQTYNGTGLIAKGWRTRILSYSTGTLRDITWAYGPTGQAVNKTVETFPGEFSGLAFYRWANSNFGSEVGNNVADILSATEMPHPVGWGGDEDITTYMTPGVIKRNSTNWSSEQSKYAFVAQLEALRPSVVGTGNLERFDYWLNAMKALRLKGEYGCVRDDFEAAMAQSKWTDALTYRRAMARLFEQIMSLEADKAFNSSDLGDIMLLEDVNWKQLMVTRHDATLAAGLGGSIPSDANPSLTYTGSPRVRVMPARTNVSSGESLNLNVTILGNPSSATLYYKELGAGSYTSQSLTNVARGVYSAIIPAQGDDFEYYIEAQTSMGVAVFPPTVPNINHTVVVSGSAPNPGDQYTLSTNVAGQGSIELSPIGGTYDEGTLISITATPDAGYQFEGWSGDATGITNPLSVTMDASKTITASFDQIASDETFFILSDISPNHTIISGSDEQVWGTSASNQITLESGAKAELINFPGQNNIQIQSSSDLFTVARSGSVVTFQGSDGTTLKIPATTEVQTISFNGEQSKVLQIYNNQVMLDDQVITTTPRHIYTWNEGTIYVSPSGDDSNDGSFLYPVATFQKGADLAKAQGATTVQFANGEYVFDKTVVLDTTYSGISFQAAPGATPVFSSLTKVTGWTTYSGNIMKANVPDGIGHVRYLQDASQGWLPRSATSEFTTTEPAGDEGCVECNYDNTEATIQQDRSNIKYPVSWSAPNWSYIDQYDLRASHLWNQEILPISSVDTGERRIYTSVPALYELRKDPYEAGPGCKSWLL